MRMPLGEELVDRHQAECRAAARDWTLARDARSARPQRPPRPTGRTRNGLAGALHAIARRLEAGGAAVP